MKTVNQILESRMHKAVRTKVRSCTQPGTIGTIIDSEMHAFLADVLEEKLKEEQDAFLGRRPYQRGGDSRKRNGYKALRLKGLFRKIVIRRPVLRTATPQSPIISLFKAFGNGIVAMIASRFWLRGTSTRATAEELNRTFGTKLNSSDISRFSDVMLPEVTAWLERPITETFEYLFLDAIYLPFKMPGSTEDEALLCAVGLSKAGKRSVLGFLVGNRENHDSWSALRSPAPADRPARQRRAGLSIAFSCAYGAARKRRGPVRVIGATRWGNAWLAPAQMSRSFAPWRILSMKTWFSAMR